MLGALLSVILLFSMTPTFALARDSGNAASVTIQLMGMLEDSSDPLYGTLNPFVRKNTKFEGIDEEDNPRGVTDSVTFSGDTYSYTIPRPYSDDMTQEEIENSAIAPYMYYTNPEDNKTYKLTCVGYTIIGGNGEEFSLNQPVTISKDDKSKTLVLMWTNELVQAQAITYSFGETPENATVYAVVQDEATQTPFSGFNYVYAYTDEQIQEQFVSTDSTFVVNAPVQAVYDVVDYIAVTGTEGDTDRKYYELVGWKLDETGEVYSVGEEIEMGDKALSFTAVWSDEPVDLTVTEEEFEKAPDIPLAETYPDTKTDAKITQKGADGKWTTEPLQLGEDRTISYRATMEMNPLVAQFLADQAITDPEFANFKITVRFDKNLILQADAGENIHFTFTCTFLKPTGEIEIGEKSIDVTNPSETDDSYTFEVPVEALNGQDSFTLPVKWRPTENGYEEQELREEIVLETIDAVMAPEAEIVTAHGGITGQIDFTKSNVSLTQGCRAVLALPEWKAYFTGSEDGQLDIVDTLKSLQIVQYALGNIVLDANPVQATVTPPEAPVVAKTATALNNDKTNVTLQITAGSAISSGFVTDIIGDDFELTDRTALDADTFTLTVNGTKQTAVVDPQNPMQVHFGTSDENGQYPYTVIYAPATETVKEQLVWKIDDGIAKDETLTLSYSLDLVNKASTQGTHVVPTNENAQLDYMLLGGATGTAEFPVPAVSYTVSGGGGVHHPDYDPDKDDEPADEPEEDIPEEDVPLAETPWLNTVDHYAYIVGYPEDYVTGQPTEDQSRWPIKPQANITRAEVATIFFRLLTDEARDEFWMTTNNFPDVAPDAWYNNAISTMVNAGLIQGYEDGTFRPNDNITRAEFAAIASRFMTSGYDVEEDLFTDISDHWARENINDAAMTQWIHGYPDGTFLPDNDITRAEAVTLVNNVLRRAPDADHMLDSMRKWPDNMDTSAWYYEAMQEATNSHDYDMFEGAEYEIWTALEENRDWAALEQDWMNAHRGGGEVM